MIAFELVSMTKKTEVADSLTSPSVRHYFIFVFVTYTGLCMIVVIVDAFMIK